ncbi:Uncharacterized protein FWK35_00025917, partial [Aphis craccivora]
MYIKCSIQTRLEETSQEYHGSTSTPIIPSLDAFIIYRLQLQADENIESHELSTVKRDNIEINLMGYDNGIGISRPPPPPPAGRPLGYDNRKASIIGYKTKKVLFVGIRNCYCVTCERSLNKKIEIPNHFCFMNWKKGATSIEADGVAEGFKKSVELHGVKFSKLI